MLSERARRFLDQCERTTAVPTADVERILREDGWPTAPAWLEFHDRYAGYVERIYRDAAVWGLVHEDSFWFGPRRAEVDQDEDEDGLFIYCAELHPAYGYRLDTTGRFLECISRRTCRMATSQFNMRLAFWPTSSLKPRP
ncbi:MAG TPA: hypothetical protein VGA04_16630 [Streptosporangiaceae bacterium]